VKVAMIVGRFPVLSETFILNQIAGLIDRGHEVDIYSDQPGDTSKVHPAVEKYQLLNRTYYIKMPSNIGIRGLKGLGLLFANSYKNPALLLRSLNVFKYGKEAASLRLLYAAVSLLGKKEYDIIHCQFGPLGFIGMSFRLIGAPHGKLITSFRGFDISQHIQEFGEDVYNPLFATGDLFLSNCDYFKRRLIKLGCDEKKIIVLRSGIDCSKFVFTTRHLPPDGRIGIVTTGRLVEKKGIEYGIRAIAKLANAYPNIEYNIVGDGPLKESLQQLIDELDVSDKVKLLGHKQQQELIEILDNSHIFIAPCVTAKNGDQDAPVNVLKEAMAMGLPVIGTQHGGIPELIEDGISGFLVPERDADTLAEKLGYLFEHPEVWPEMGRSGRAYVETHYDFNKLNERLVEIYH
jgi:colanic acid/amylovoran biosynthesis glycosyltransferase